MKTFAFAMRRHTVADPLTIQIVKNDLGILPEWFIDGPSTYRAVFAAPIGFCPRQVIPMLGGEFFYIVAEGAGTQITINTMIDDSTGLEAELTDYYLELRILDNFGQTSATPE